MPTSRMNTARYNYALILLVFSLGPESLHGQDAARPVVLESWRDDADLYDVTFADEEYGWAVGDHGTIWHTQNGGEIWRPQTAPVDTPLRGVHFIDRQHGWAVGGAAIPLTHMAKGVVLKTKDGGKTWEEIEGLLLPWINAVHFATSKRGMVVGHASSSYPTGAWTTNDGGRTWSPLSGERGVHWLQADFHVPLVSSSGIRPSYVALLRGHDGRVARLANGRISTVLERTAGWSQHSIVSLFNSNVGFAGVHGLSLSADRGQSWQPMGQFEPDRIQRQMKWRSMALQENQAWLAGSPGNRILHSLDYGQSWRSVVAPSTMPIHKLHFASSQSGWAVGASGTILSTKDAGKTWNRQRSGTKRNALLGVFADQREIPWQLLAQASAVDEYRTHLVLLAVAGDSQRSCLEQRLQHAASQVGATAEILTPRSICSEVDLPADRMLASWRLQGTSATDWLSERITRIIRVRRPDVVLTSELGKAPEATGMQRLTTRLVADACDYAETEHAFPAQGIDFGLVPWRVSRSLKCVAKPRTSRGAKSKRKSGLGYAPEDLAMDARRLLGTEIASSAWTLRSLRDEKGGELGTQPFAGLVVEYGSAARRVRPAPLRTSPRLSNIAVAIARAGGQGISRVERLETLAGSDVEAAGRLLFDLAAQEQSADERDLLLRELVTRHPQHPLTNAAIFRLVRDHTSLERKWRDHRERPIQPTASLLATEAEDLPRPDSAVRLASSETPSDPTAFQADWKVGLRLLQEIESKRPVLSSEPEVAFPLATLARQGPRLARSKLQQQLFPNGWPHYAKLELMLVGSEPDEQQQASIWLCREGTSRPHLDGDLTDEIWKAADFRPLRVVDANSGSQELLEPTLIGIAKDSDYLYLAVHSPKRSDIQYDPMRKQRPRDADLSARDRVRVNLDINRDYTSWWSFTFDHRGWTNDRLMGDPSWDPKYYVAMKADERVWVIEAAIPLDSLAPAEYRDSTYWAIGVERIVPETHVERWNSANTAAPPANLQGILHVQ